MICPTVLPAGATGSPQGLHVVGRAIACSSVDGCLTGLQKDREDGAETGTTNRCADAKRCKVVPSLAVVLSVNGDRWV